MVQAVEKLAFLVKIEPGEDGYFVASCASIPGCFSQGKTYDEAIENITEAIEAYTECLAQEQTEDDVSVRLVNVPSALSVA